jgi:hypothetical protein
VWEVEVTEEFNSWFQDLESPDDQAVAAAIDKLAEEGPNLKRPLVGLIESSDLHHLKELRVTGTGGKRIRVLFAFDPRSTAILLIGGDKTGNWKRWYDEMIPQAEGLYSTYLEELREEGLLP